MSDVLSRPSRRVMIRLTAERSSYNAAMALADHLRAHGHTVVFAGAPVAALAEHAASQGIEHVSVGPDPIERTRRFLATRSPVKRLKLRLELQRETVKAWKDFAESDGKSFDLAFLDVVSMEPSAYAMSEIGMATLVLSPNYGSRWTSRHPPTYSSAVGIASPEWPDRLSYLLGWSRVWLVREVYSRGPTYLLLSPLRLAFARMFPFTRARAKTRKNGWRFCYSEWGTRFAGPEVVIGHRALDWDALRASESRCYLAQSPAQRADRAQDWCTGLDVTKVLVYCNTSRLLPATGEGLRSQARSRRGKLLFVALGRYLDAVIAAFRDSPEKQLVVACGGFADAYGAGNLPAHIRVLRSVPQLDVLQHADLVITPGGAGTVRECVSAGVPMLVFPMWTDQFGNAARVQHFGMGLDGGDFRRATKERVEQLVARALGGPELRTSVAEARARVVDREAEWQALRAFVERHTGVTL